MVSTEREEWERLWSICAPTDFFWYRSHIESPLADLVESLGGSRVVALDIGCGSGIVTRFLAEHFSFTIGLDHAPSAVAQAAVMPPNVAVYGVSDASALPIADGAVALVVDRGCSHILPEDQIRPFLDEVARVLEPGGRYVLVARVHGGFPPGPRAMRRIQELTFLLAAKLRRGSTTTPRELRARFPSSLSVESITHIRQRSDAGFHQHHLYAVAIRH